MHMLQTAVATDSYDLYKKYSKIINEQNPLNLRDLLDFNLIRSEYFLSNESYCF